MARIDEHQASVKSEHLDYDVYVCGDDDEQSEDWRLSFVGAGTMVSLDVPPAELAKIGRLIWSALHDEGYCEHGVPFDGSYCAECAP